MKKTTFKIASACLASCIALGSFGLTGAALADNVKSSAAATPQSADQPAAARNIQAKVGESFKITLEENPSTGYAWSYELPSGLELVSEKTEDLPGTEPDLVGAPSQKTFTFKAAAAGTYTLNFTYARPWEPDDASAEKVSYQIQVAEPSGSTNAQAVALSPKKVNVLSSKQLFQVTLEENATTGYTWNYQNDKKSIKVVSAKSQAESSAIGAPSQKTWTFRAEKPGIYKLQFLYSQFGKVDTSKTVTYTIKVK